MHSSRLLMLLVAVPWAVVPVAAQAQNSEPSPARDAPGAMAQLKIDIDAFRSKFATGSIGLKPPTSAKDGVDLPFGMNYSRDTKSLLMPLDEKNEWGIGLNLNLNKTPDVELAPSGLGLQPKRAPGVVIQRKF